MVLPAVTDPSDPYFKDGNWGWDGTQWRKLNLVWGLYEQYYEEEGNPDADAGTNTLDFSTVPPGEVWIITAASAVDVDSAALVVGFILQGTGKYGYLANKVPIAANEICAFQCNWILEPGDNLRAYFLGCTALDDIRAYANGYKMQITA